MEWITSEAYLEKLAVLAIAGILYVCTLYKLSRYNVSSNAISKISVIRIIFSSLLFMLACLYFVLIWRDVVWNDCLEKGYSLCTYGDSSTTTSGIVRLSTDKLIWGQDSRAQVAVMGCVYSTFAFIGYALYVLRFRASDTSKGKKFGKVIAHVLLYGVFVNIGSFHYFDIYEFFPILSILSIAILLIWKCRVKSTIMES